MKKKLSEMTLEELWQLFPIILRPHNPDYFNWYREEKEAICAALPGRVSRIEHIGSTSVSGLAAKPIVDILLEIPEKAEVPDLIERLSGLGYLVMKRTGEPDFRIDLCKGYREEGFAERVFHLHVRHPGDWDEPYFRDYLRRHRDAAERYEALKRQLAVEFKHDRDGYTAAKTELVKELTAAARLEQKSTIPYSKS